MSSESEDVFQEVSEQCLAPSKLNLRLRIVGRDHRQYHLLSMCNVTTTLSDVVFIRCSPTADSPSVSLSCSFAEGIDPGVVGPAESNLAVRAASEMLALLELPLSVQVSLQKRIPVGAGLGGGSSDAASVISFFERHFAARCAQRRGLKRSELSMQIDRLALSLGADVPFFLRAGCAYVSGVGERISPVDFAPLRGIAAAIIMPREGCPTVEIFRRYRERNPVIPDGGDLLGPSFSLIVAGLGTEEPRERAAAWGRLLALVHNDLEQTVREYTPAVGRLLDLVREDPGVVAAVTGSGSALFVLSRDPKGVSPDQCAALRQRAATTGAQVYPVQLISTERLGGSWSSAPGA